MPSKAWTIATPVLAVLATMVAGGIMFALLGKDPIEAIRTIFWDPLFSEQFAAYSRPQLLVKAGPLILIAIGLSLGFRAGIWNIGAEGQYIMGAIAGAAVGLAFYPASGWYVFPLMVAAGAAGGWIWAMIPAILRTHFNTNEILVSLLLVYVAEHILSAMSFGLLRNPDGHGFPGSRSFNELTATANPELIANSGMHWGVVAGVYCRDLRLCFANPPLVGLPDNTGWAVTARRAFWRREPERTDHFMLWICRCSGWGCWVVRGHRPRQTADRKLWPRLWLYRDHRRLFGSFASGRHLAGGPADGADLYWRRPCPTDARPARPRHSGVPRHAAYFSFWRWMFSRTFAFVFKKSEAV